mgnify:CR=1 FL=1
MFRVMVIVGLFWVPQRVAFGGMLPSLHRQQKCQSMSWPPSTRCCIPLVVLEAYEQALRHQGKTSEADAVAAMLKTIRSAQ